MEFERNKHLLIPVISISRPIWEELELLTNEAVLLGMFERAVNLLIGESVIALVLPELQNGAFHIVVPFLPNLRTSALWIKKLPEGLQIGDTLLQVSATSKIWEPKPDWEAVNISSDTIQIIKVVALEEMLEKEQFDASPFGEVFKGKGVPLLAELSQAVWSTNQTQVTTAVSKIAGLGPGLTPSGDDFLSGLMLAIYALKQSPDSLAAAEQCRRIYEAAAGRTTRLSRAFLQSAARGYCDERWHTFLRAVSGRDENAVRDSVHRILSFGATSGMDMLSGFLWMFETALYSNQKR